MPLDLIAQAAFQALASTAGLPPVYWPNISIPEAPEAIHLRAFVLPADTESRGLVGWDVEQGIIQVSVYAKQGVGVIAPYATAEAVLGAFPRGFSTAAFKVHLAGSIGPAIIDGAWCSVTVSIPYQNVR